MNAPSTQPTDWQVPASDTVFWRGRQFDHCIVIPVINEGDRIRRQLQRMSELAIHEQADVIIIDGGSSDGSLERGFLEECGVRGLLVKTGPGKLSAQLRCAYAFALQEGYQGIVTIDGNDKDDPATISRFISALEEGIDFVQASRFIEEGQGINTPASREFGIRYIHAPMLRAFSGFAWTDTTQGFRAYSRPLLLDERVAPFREVFDSYELLAYLSYRAPKLGFRCQEVPSTRRYPEGAVPSKIGGIKGNLALLGILFSACFGRYNP